MSDTEAIVSWGARVVSTAATALVLASCSRAAITSGEQCTEGELRCDRTGVILQKCSGGRRDDAYQGPPKNSLACVPPARYRDRMDESQFDRLARVMEAGFNTLADLISESNTRLDRLEIQQRETNTRLDRLEVQQRETNTRLDRLEIQQRETNTRLERLEGRFDHFLDVAGGETRRLREEMTTLTSRVDRLERKAA